ncbi:uncharacterized protein LOC143878955 [Tasmannia lanceolata]|uniref:uncharacterized protein LOC143878955 n=1 Tax=Tasmannia lanceolata TaxID=3420 RepID=UPI004064AF1F
MIIWTILETTHEGTSQVKKSKVSLLVSDLEAFKMNENESISEMYRFTNNVNELEGLGKTYANLELVTRLLRCLPFSWDSKVTVIEESKNLDNVKLDELVGSLITHEMKMKRRKNQQPEASKLKEKDRKIHCIHRQIIIFFLKFR